MSNLIYTREPIDGTGLLREINQAEADMEDFKATQKIGGDSLVVHYYTQRLDNEVVAAFATAAYQSTFTFDEPPVNTFVNLSFAWVTSTPLTYFDQQYDEPATLGSTTEKKRILRFSPDTSVSDVTVVAYAKSTAPGVLSLERLG